MYNSNQGHGICGAKNSYSSKIRVGNWVEDNIGMDLSKSKSSNKLPVNNQYETIQAASYCPIEKRKELPSLPVNMPTTQELKAKNKEGMPYALLFDHGVRDIPAEDRFKTTAMMVMSKPSETFNTTFERPHKTLERQKSKQNIQDLNLSFVKSSEYNISTSHLAFVQNTTPKASIGNVQELPRFNRTRPLTSTFPQKNDLWLAIKNEIQYFDMLKAMDSRTYLNYMLAVIYRQRKSGEDR
eukprot:gene6092-8395_t